MRPAPLAPIAWRSAPRHCGPWEQVVANLTDGLVKLGIGVSLQPTGDSGTRANLRSVVARGHEADSSYRRRVERSIPADTVRSRFAVMRGLRHNLTSTRPVAGYGAH
jgi:hypothetical protein